MVRKIGCFITEGWTEAGAMNVFLKKINHEFEYIQCFPAKRKYPKGLKQSEFKYSKESEGIFNGITGEALIKEVYRRIDDHKNEYQDFCAIIIEDDLDCRYHEKSVEQIEEDKRKIRKNIWDKLGKEIPVIFLFASPEIEAWFICDWDNSFVYVYKNPFFCYHLKKYLDEIVIKDYWQKGIENYGMKDGRYTKLSDSLQHAVAIGVKNQIRKIFSNGKIPKTAQSIIDNRMLHYSKKIHGDMMLRNIEPDNFVEQCNIYFKPAFIELRELTA